MVQMKETRERLYKLLLANFVYIQEVPKSSDHAPQKTFYLWGVKFDHLVNQMCGESYKSIRNLKLKQCSLREENADIISVAEQLPKGQSLEVALGETGFARFQKLKTMEGCLEVSATHIDQALMVLQYPYEKEKVLEEKKKKKRL